MSAPPRFRLSSNVTLAIPGNFDTMQIAWDTIQKEIDLNGFHIFILVKEGNHGPLVASGTLTGAGRIDAVTFTGNLDHPEKTIIRGVNSDAIVIKDGAWLKIEGFMVGTIRSPYFMGAGHGIVVYNGARAILGVMAYDDCEWSQIQIADSVATATGTQYLLGRSRIFGLAEDGAKLYLNGAHITNRVPLHYPHAFFHASRGAMIDLSGTIINDTGSPLTGKAYDIRSNSVIILLYIDLHDLRRGTVESGGVAVNPRSIIQKLKWRSKSTLIPLIIMPFVYDVSQDIDNSVSSKITLRSVIPKLWRKMKDAFFRLVVKQITPWREAVERQRVLRQSRGGAVRIDIYAYLKWRVMVVLFSLLIEPFVHSHDARQESNGSVASTINRQSTIQKLWWEIKDAFFELVVKKVAPWRKVVERHRIRRQREDENRESRLPKEAV